MSNPEIVAAEIVEAAIVETPRGRSAGEILFTLRLALVLMTCMAVIALTVLLWRTAELRFANPPGDHFSKTPEQVAAKAEVLAIEAELKQERERLARLQDLSKAWPEQFTATTAVAQATPFQFELLRLLGERSKVEEYHLTNLKRLGSGPGDLEFAKERIRQAMQSGDAQIGRMCRLILTLGDGELRQELLASLESADRAKMQYRLYDADGLVDL